MVKINVENEKGEFFSRREIWEQVFGKDGRGGAIGELDGKVDDKFNHLEDMICQEFEKVKKTMTSLSTQISEYNGLHERVDEVEENLKQHIDAWNEFSIDMGKQEAIATALKDERKKGRDESDRSFNRRVRTISIWVGIASILIGATIAVIRMLFF